jgi:hypothetical protein
MIVIPKPVPSFGRHASAPGGRQFTEKPRHFIIGSLEPLRGLDRRFTERKCEFVHKRSVERVFH